MYTLAAMVNFFRRRPLHPTAHEMLDASMASHDYKTAALFILAGATAMLEEIRAELPQGMAEAQQRELTLRMALHRVGAGL